MISADSFEEFVHATGERLMRTAVLLCRDREEAHDLVQSAYAQIFARWRLVVRAENPVAYARTVLTRTFLKDRQRQRVRQVPLDHVPEPATSVADTDLRLAMVQVLAELAPLDRAALVLRYLEDLPSAEVADLLGLSDSACRTRISRALARVRTHFPDLEA